MGTVMAFILPLHKSVIYWYAYFTTSSNPIVKIINSKERIKLLAYMMSLVLIFLLLLMEQLPRELIEIRVLGYPTYGTKQRRRSLTLNIESSGNAG